MFFCLDDFVSKRMEKHNYWFDKEIELNFIIFKLHELIMTLYSKNMYHSDLKLVNTIIC